MQRLIFCFAFFLSNTVVAQVPADAVDQINALLKSAGTQAEPCFSCSELSVGNTPTVRRCVEAICPNSAFSYSVVVQNAISGAKKDERFDKELMPLLLKIALNSTDEEIADSENLVKWLESKKKISDPAANLLANVFESIGDVFNEDFTSIQKNRVDRVNEILQILENIWSEESSLDAFHFKYPGDQFQAQLKKNIEEIRKSEAKFRGNHEFSFFINSTQWKDFVNIEKISQQIEEGAITEDSFSWMQLSRFIYRVLDEAGKKKSRLRELLEHPFILTDEKAKEIIAYKKDQIKKYQKRKERIQKGDTGDITESCRRASLIANNFLPSSAEIKNTAAQLPGYKSNFLTGIKKLLSSESFGRIEKPAKNWKVKLAKSPDEHYREMLKGLTTEADYYSAWKGRFNDLKDSSDYDRLMLVMVSNAMSNTNSEGEEEFEPESICDGLVPGIYPDSAYTTLGGFVVGPMVVKFGALAEGLVYHEMGHLLIEELKKSKMSKQTKGWLDSSLQCLANNHKNVYGGDGALYEDEDWADFIAASVWPDQNFACSFVRKSKFNLDKYDGLSLKNHDSSDDHSADLYRALFVHAMGTKPMPEVCKTALADKGFAKLPLSCAAQR